MTIDALVGARILSGGTWHNDHALIIADGIISSIVKAGAVPTSAQIVHLESGILIPGFVDTQVNGGGGVLFNDQPNVDGLISISQAHRRFGTTAMLPTLISDDLEVIATAIAAVDEAIAEGVPGIVGIHIEGPFLNAVKRGIHDSAKFRKLDRNAISLLSSLRLGKTLVTLAPELAPAGAIATLIKNGVTVSAGHTLATYEEMQLAISEGLSGVTHLYNAMTQMESRAPGVVGASFDSNLVCGIIADGHHVHPASLRAAFRAKGVQGLMLVTDAMPTVGSHIQSFRLGDTEITASEGMLRSGGGTLAGSDLDMASAFRNCVEMMHVNIASASQMASSTPAAFLGLGAAAGEILPGHRADLVHLNDGLEVRRVWVAGEPM